MNGDEGTRLGQGAARRLAQIGHCPIGPGLTGIELARIERDHDFEFAADHRAFLAAGLPLNTAPQADQTWRKPWPDWRDGTPGDLRRQLNWPIDGVLFDVENNAFWHPTWGKRPAGTSEARQAARQYLSQVPKMIPISGHRYLPGGHRSYGHPVLSIYQTDVIVYGTDLANYITNDFSGSGWFISEDWTPPPMVPFWSELL